LQAPIRSPDQGEALAKLILNRLGGTYDLDGYKVVVTASIGIALATSQIDPDQFLRIADMLCIGRQSRAAQRGAGLSQVWRPSLMRAELLNSICATP
jgi:predicted signal transduction protein with EAL and GGDEF domain